MAKNGDIMLKQISKSIKAVFDGLRTVFKHLFQKAVTEEYPEKRPNLNKNFRGGHILHNCRGCGYCIQVCPAKAITIERQESDIKYFVDIGKCIFCGNCVYYCPAKSMEMTPKFEFATAEKEQLIVEITNLKG